MNPKHTEALRVLQKANVDPTIVKVVESALLSDGRMDVIRDAFLEGRDHEAVSLLRQLDPLATGDHRILGFGSDGMIYAGSSALISVRPQVPFKVHRMMVGINCAANFLVDDIRVGTHYMTPAAGSIPADVFSFLEEENVAAGEPDPDEQGFWRIRPGTRIQGLGLRIDMPWCEPGMEIYLNVTNTSGLATTFRGAFLGTIRPAYYPNEEALF